MTARVTSFGRLFATETRRDLRLDAIATEARERGANTFDLDAFITLAETRSALKELTGAEQDSSHPVAVLLFHAFHFKRGGADLVVTPAPAVRSLIRRRPDESWTPGPDPAASYVRFPENLIQVAGGDADAPTWLGGFYWVHGAGRLSVLAELFSTPVDFSFLPLPALPLAVVPVWAREHVREDGGDFTDPTGKGDESRLHIAVAAEILKLATLTIWMREARATAEVATTTEGGAEVAKATNEEPPAAKATDEEFPADEGGPESA